MSLVRLLLVVLLVQAQPITVTTRLVEVSVVVEGKNGRPLTDFSKDDFDILENGRPQPIRLFLKNSGASAHAESLPPGVVSNRGGSSAETGQTRTTVILFDALNTPWEHRNYAGRHLARFVKSVPPEDRIAVLLLSSSGLRVLHNDKRVKLPNFREDALLAGGETSAEVQQADRFTHDRIQLSLRAMEAIAEHMAGVNGRKNLLWITAGIPRQINLYEDPHSLRDRASYKQDYVRAISALNRSSIAVYTIDARGLDAFGPSALTYGPQNRWEVPKLDGMLKLQESREGMRDLASATGGRAYFDRNDLDRAMTEVLDDAAASYTLGYYQPGDADGTWRRIQVRVKRDGASARHRAGYLAVDPEDSREDALKRALASPLESTALGVTGALQRRPDGTWQALLQIDPRNVAFVPAGTGYRCRLEIVTMARDENGKPVGKTEIDTLDLPLSGDSLKRTQENGVLFRKDLKPGPTAFDVRFGIRDPVTGLVATLSIPLAQR